MGFKFDATDSAAGLQIISDLVKKYLGPSVTFSSLPPTVSKAFVSAATSIMDGTNLYISKKVGPVLRDVINPKQMEYGVFAEWVRDAGPEYGFSDETSIRTIAEIADGLGYDIYRVEHGFFGDEDFLIMASGYDPEDYCRSTDLPYEDLGEISDVDTWMY